MALTRQSAWASMHLAVRLLGLTGLMVGLAGLVIWFALGEDGIGPLLTVIGFGLVGLNLIAEVPGALNAMGSRRGAMGSNVLVQIGLATALIFAVNFVAFKKYKKFDLTRGGDFTLKQDIHRQLSQLEGDTSIIILKQYVGGHRADTKQDKTELAAQKKIVDKVIDLAEMFRDLGPRFQVQQLDINDDGFQAKLDKIAKVRPELHKAILKAPENSIFFHAKDKDSGRESIQRLGFGDIYQLDKQASEKEKNLVLVYQGQQGFANKAFHVEEKNPRIGMAIVHQVLGLNDPDDPRLTHAGAAEVLQSRHFQTLDIILKKWGGGPPEPVVMTFEENRFDRLEKQIQMLDTALSANKKVMEQRNALHNELQAKSLKELNKLYGIVETLRGDIVLDRADIDQLLKARRIREKDVFSIDEQGLAMFLKSLESEAKEITKIYEDQVKLRDQRREEMRKLDVDTIAETRRLTDLKAKLDKHLDDVDLLIVPRSTLFDIGKGRRIQNRAHALDEAQVTAIKEFMKKRKPVLFCLGPTNEPGSIPDFPGMESDKLEAMLTEIGFNLPKQTILFDSEIEALAEAEDDPFTDTVPSTPPLILGKLESAPAITRAKRVLDHEAIAGSLDLARRRFSGAQTQSEEGRADAARNLDLSIRHPRPVYFQADQETSKGRYGFLYAPLESWNEDEPFPSREKPIKYEPAKPNDPNKNTVKERRKGPFPVAAAVETELPKSWFSDGQTPPKVRLAVIGHGAVFSGDKLSPLREKLLLDVCNWLMGRDDLLSQQTEATWSYPRVQMSDLEYGLWAWGAFLGIPLVFVYLGFVMLLVRRMR